MCVSDDILRQLHEKRKSLACSLWNIRDDILKKCCCSLGFFFKRGSPLCKLLGAEEIGLFWLVDSYWGYLISHWLAILLIMVGFSTKPNAETAVCHWIMIWCWFLLTKIDVMYTVQDIWWGLLADEKRESIIEDILKNGSQGHIYSTTNSSACKMLCLHVSSSSWIRGSSSSDE